MARTRETYWLYAGAVVALLPILLLRDFTPANELRYLSIADEALRNHTFFSFTNQGVPYADKPPLYLWLVMLCRWMTGGHYMGLLALFSLLPAWGILRIMDRWTAQEMGSGSRILAQWMLLTCGLFLGAAVTLRMDMLMCFFIVLSLRTFWKILKGEGYRELNCWLFPLYLFLALFSKGPIGLLVPLCSTFVYLGLRRRFADFFRCWGLRTWGVLLLCCGLWFAAVYAEGGSDYLYDLLFRQTAGRAIHSFHHAKPFYYYAIHIWYCLAPWSLLVIGILAFAPRLEIARSDLHRFLLTVGATTLCLLSCISSKLQIYLLPAIPFLVYATVLSLPDVRRSQWTRMALVVPALLFALALPGLLVLAHAMDDVPYLHSGVIHAAATILTLCGVCTLYHLFKQRAEGVEGAIRRLGAGLLLTLFVGAWSLPNLNAYIGYGALCHRAQEVAEQSGISDIRTWHLARPEHMDVYLNCPLTVVERNEVPAPDAKPYLLLTRRTELQRFSGTEAFIIGPYAVVIMECVTPDRTSR